MSQRQRPWSIWEIWDGLREIVAAAGLPVPPRTSEMDWMAYDRFNTGLTFADVVRMLWVPSSDPADWRRKSRGPILYTFSKLKKDMWRERERREDELALGAVPMSEPTSGVGAGEV
jgi:hypothetical protein